MKITKDQLLPPDTDRLTFRPLTQEDVEIWKEFVTSDEAMKFFSFPRIESESTVWIDRQVQRYRDAKGGMTAVIDKNSGVFLGQCGLMIQELDGEEVMEVGYSFLPSHWKKGYATEAARVYYEYGFTLGIAEFIVSIIHVENKASQAVAARNGLSVWKRTTWRNLPVEVWRIRRPSGDV